MKAGIYAKEGVYNCLKKNILIFKMLHGEKALKNF